MALTKAAGTILINQSVPAGTTVTGTSVSITAIYGGKFHAKIVNGASAPTTQPTLEIQTSPDGTNWYREYLFAGDLTASSVNSWSPPCAVGTMYARGIFNAGSTNASTFELLISEVTAY